MEFKVGDKVRIKKELKTWSDRWWSASWYETDCFVTDLRSRVVRIKNTNGDYLNVDANDIELVKDVIFEEYLDKTELFKISQMEIIDRTIDEFEESISGLENDHFAGFVDLMKVYRKTLEIHEPEEELNRIMRHGQIMGNLSRIFGNEVIEVFSDYMNGRLNK